MKSATKLGKVQDKHFIAMNFHKTFSSTFRTNMTKNRPNSLNINLFASYPRDLRSDANTVPLYPYQSSELVVLFIYGTDYQRQTNNNLFGKLQLILLNWTTFFMILSAIVLCFIRRLSKLRRDGFISVLIDICVIFIGGGRLRMDHKLERWLFVIVSIGALFLNSFTLTSILFPSYLQPQRSIETFQQLAEIKPPFHIGRAFSRDEPIILEMLRFSFLLTSNGFYSPNINSSPLQTKNRCQRTLCRSRPYNGGGYEKGHLICLCYNKAVCWRDQGAFEKFA